VSAAILVAGVGNIFLSDDGFGVAVAARLASEPMPPEMKVADFGIRGVHLAYELMNGYDGLILVDAVSQGGSPGTLYVIEPDLDDRQGGPAMDAHSMSPDTVFSLFQGLGVELGQVYVVGCEPADLSDGMDLSPAVAAAVGEAAGVVRDLALKMLAVRGV
jgi:hydrogenase maturation protease